MLIRTSFALVALNANAGSAMANPENDLTIRLGEPVETQINEKPVRILVSPDAVSVPSVNADTAQRVGLKQSMIGYRYGIGPVRITFSTDNVEYRFGASTFRARTAFSRRRIVENADGIAGPATFPFRRTIFILRAKQKGDQAIVLPLDKEMGRSQTGVRLMVGGQPIYAAFSFDRQESLVTATGGRWIADAFGGRFEGDARDAPILYGVARPIRSLRLERPLKLGELEIRNLAVRLSDLGSANGIAADNSDEQDPNEIVVTADSKKKIPKQRLFIGMDAIGHCASITYDFAANTVTLLCPDQPPPK